MSAERLDRERQPRRRHERNQTVYWSDGSDEVAGVHDNAFALNGRQLARRKRTVKTLNLSVKRFMNIFSTAHVADISIRAPATIAAGLFEAVIE